MDQLTPFRPVSIDLEIAEGLRNKEFREAFFRSELDVSISGQIKTLRKLRGFNQAQLAALLQTKQSAISRMEKDGYGKWGIETLQKLADALDARLAIILEPVELVIERAKSEASALTVGSASRGAISELGARPQPGERDASRMSSRGDRMPQKASSEYGTRSD